MGHGGDILGFATDLRIIPEDNIGIYMAFNFSSIPGKNQKNEIAYFFYSGTEAYHKLAYHETVNFQMIWIGLILIVCLFVLIRSICLSFSKKRTACILDKLQAGIALLVFIFLGVVSASLATTDPQEFLYGLPSILEWVLYIPFVIIVLLAFYAFLLFGRTQPNCQGSKSFYVLVLIVFLTFLWWLWQWNLLGFNF